ncbi:MAG TPA: MFS transporter [Arachnia sp.]|nr:MFS transporter [Arachnia sp.]HMT86567.1 MFS transporter [Arachnia sp.]
MQTDASSTSVVSPVTPSRGIGALPPAGRSALKGGVVGNFVDNVHVFLPAFALVPAMASLAGPDAAATSASWVVIAMLLGRPVGGLLFGRLSDRWGRTRITNLAITGTALCALAIAVVPSYLVLGTATIALVLILRFISGIFVAGQYSAAIPLAMEWARPAHRGLLSGLILSMAPWAQAAISFATAGLLVWLGAETYTAWGWRALFVAGALASGGMLLYYRRRVTDAPVFHRAAATPQPRAGVKEVLVGRHRRAFWQVFVMMTGLWILTNMTVLLLPGRLTGDVGLAASHAAATTGFAAMAQAVVMAIAGHLSTVLGRRRLLMAWGLAAALLGPLVWWALIGSTGVATAALLAALLQVVTVSAYGPVAAYLSERFPTRVRSTGYGMGYSLSLVLPALHPFYLPPLAAVCGHQGAVMVMIALGGALVVLGAFLGPRLSPRDLDGDLDEVAEAAAR